MAGMTWFTKLENINWTRLWWIVTILSGFWAGIATILPDTYFKPVTVVLQAIQAAMLFAARGSKFVVSRQEPPADGKV